MQSGKVMLIRVGERNAALRCGLFRRLAWFSIVLLQLLRGAGMPASFQHFCTNSMRIVLGVAPALFVLVEILRFLRKGALQNVTTGSALVVYP